MKNMTRTDAHRPSAINPAEYEFVAQELIPIGRYSGDILSDCAFLQAERARISRHMARTGGTYSRHEHGGNCMVCGSVNAIYTALFYHAKSNSYIRMGSDCAEKCEMGDAASFAYFRTQADNAYAAYAGKRKAQAILAENNLTAAWDLFVNAGLANTGLTYKYEEHTICDMVRKLVNYGNLSEKQFAFMGRLFTQIESRKATTAKRDAETAAAKEIPSFEGRVEIEGVVLSHKYDSDSAFPGYRMLVQHADGWKVWGTAPDGVVKGQTIRFSASVIVSQDDKKFGYFKRPTKLVVVKDIEVEAEVAVA